MLQLAFTIYSEELGGESTWSIGLNAISNRVQSLCQPEPCLKPKPKPLHRGAVSHKLCKLGWVRGRLVPQVREALRGRDVTADRPGAGAALVLGAQDEVVKQLGPLHMWRVTENAGVLRPRDVLALRGLREIERRRRAEAASGCKKGSPRGIPSGDGGWGGGSAHPQWVLLQERVEP